MAHSDNFNTEFWESDRIDFRSRTNSALGKINAPCRCHARWFFLNVSQIAVIKVSNYHSCSYYRFFYKEHKLVEFLIHFNEKSCTSKGESEGSTPMEQHKFSAMFFQINSSEAKLGNRSFTKTRFFGQTVYFLQLCLAGVNLKKILENLYCFHKFASAAFLFPTMKIAAVPLFSLKSIQHSVRMFSSIKEFTK